MIWESILSGSLLPGSKIAYQIRFDSSRSAATRVVFMTEGVLLRQVLSDACLRQYDVLVVDEVHERHVSTDVLLGLLKSKVLPAAPNLRLVRPKIALLASRTEYSHVQFLNHEYIHISIHIQFLNMNTVPSPIFFSVRLGQLKPIFGRCYVEAADVSNSERGAIRRLLLRRASDHGPWSPASHHHRYDRMYYIHTLM
eukprot:SAG31_NODE_6804_length_1882_cov_1.317443_1_plen_197_part_00